MSSMIYCLVFSIPYTTFRRHQKEQFESKGKTTNNSPY